MVANSEKTGTIDIMVFEGRNIIPMDDTGNSCFTMIYFLKGHQIHIFEYTTKRKELKLKRELISNPTR